MIDLYELGNWFITQSIVAFLDIIIPWVYPPIRKPPSTRIIWIHPHENTNSVKLERGLDSALPNEHNIALLDGVATLTPNHTCVEVPPGSFEELQLLLPPSPPTNEEPSFSSCTIINSEFALPTDHDSTDGIDCNPYVVLTTPPPRQGHDSDAATNVSAVNRRCAISILYYAACVGRRDIVDYLLDLGIDPNTRFERDYNILMLALLRPSLDFFRYLVLVCGVDPNLGSSICRHIAPKKMEFFVNIFNYPAEQTLKDVGTKMRLCLLRGANWSSANSNSNMLAVILDQASKNLPCDRCGYILLEHFALYEFLELPVNRRSMRTIEATDQCWQYVEKCKAELASMRDLRFYNHVTLLNMLIDSDRRLTEFVHNEELLLALFEALGTNKFPIYMRFLLERVDNFMYLSEMREKAIKVLLCTLHGAVDYESVTEIVKYLSKRDLYKLSKFYAE